MTKLSALVVSLALLVAACGGSSSSDGVADGEEISDGGQDSGQSATTQPVARAAVMAST